MKLSKLRFVFAFVLLVAVSVVCTNVQATTMPNNGQIKLKTIIDSAQAIVDGDDDTTVVADNTVKTFNTTYNATILGTTMNPVQAYTLCVKGTSTYKAYSLNPGSVSEQDAEYTYAGTSSNVRVGLGLAFGLNSLTSTQLDNQADLSSYNQAYSYATQVYLWLANNNALGTANEEAAKATLTGTDLDRYTYIRNSVEQSLLAPSYTYTTEAEAKANPTEMGWSEANQRYEVTLPDTNALDTMALVNLAVQPGSSISYSKNGNNITFYSTEQVGSVSSPVTVTVTKSINGGRYVAGVASLSDGSNSFAYLTGLAEDNDVYYVSLYTNALRVKVQKTLNANNASGNTNTGDATVEGARYGVYSDSACTQLVQEITTDASGVAYTDPVEYKDYWVKELSASEGCKVNSTVMKATATSATTESNGQRVVTVSSSEDVIYGGFRMIVSTSPDLSGSTTKVPSVGSEITLTLDSDSTQTYTATVDEQGYVEFVDIPYGQYTCTETKRPNVEGAEDVDLMDPMGININTEETYIYSKIVNTEVAQRYVKILKYDAEDGALVTSTSTTYRVVNSAGETVSQKTMYPKVQEMDEFVTADDDGIYGYVVLPEKLPADTYSVYEVTAPTGYYNQSAATGKPIATFAVEPNSTEDYDRTQMVEVETSNTRQKGILNISVTGNVLSDTNTQEAYGQTGVERPAYTSQAIPGASYKLVAKENIVSGTGKVLYNAGDVVFEGTTDSTGKLTTKLDIGTYTLTMTAAPEGYVLDTAERTITVTAQDQTVKEYTLSTEKYTLTRQDYDLDMTKVFSELNFYKQGQDSTAVSINAEAYKDVIVGIYAAEDITNVKGETIIEKDTLVDVVIFDENGNGTFASEYPMGKFYAKEIATNENYQVSTEKYSFETKPTNTSDARFAVSVGEIVNEPLKETTFTFTKIEEVEVSISDTETTFLSQLASFAEGVLDGILADVEKTTDVTRLADAEYEIYYLDSNGTYYQLLEKVDGELVTVTRTTDENGEFTIEGLPYGTYAVKEVTAPRYYDVDDNKYKFTLTTSDKDAELVLQDVRTKVDVNMAVVDEDGNKLEGVTVQLVDPETNEVAYEEETDEYGIVTFTQIRAGRYIRQVTDLAEQYVTPEVSELYLDEDTETTSYMITSGLYVDEENETAKSWVINYQVAEVVEVKYVTGSILINKTDDETGDVVAGCLFRITDSDGNVVCEETTDDNGQLLVAGLRYGVYYVEEAEAAEGYEKSDLVYEVTITEDGQTYVVDFTNVPTGDIAVALYAIIALVSVAAITMTVKKLKRD